MKIERRLVKTGPGCLGCTIPKDLIEKYGLQYGDWVAVDLGSGRPKP